jgi:prepilin-type N-terminal cleavage/methylation domain-containing protein
MSRTCQTPAGFTLLELIIALTLTSALVLVIYSSLSITLKGMQRGQATSELLQEIRVGQAILERSISSAVRGSLGNKLYFLGAPQEMRFFTLVPLEASSLGGIYHWRLMVGKDGSGQDVLAVEQTRNVNWQRDPEGVEVRQIVLRHLTAAQFSYGRGETENSTWEAEKEGKLPSWVKIRLSLTGRQSLVLLIPMYVAESKDATAP